MLAIDRSLSGCIVYTCRRLIDLSLVALYILYMPAIDRPSDDCRYSHDDGITAGTVLSNGNQNINFMMSCDDQVEGTFLRSVFLSDTDKLVTFDWRMHPVNHFEMIEGQWFFYVVAVSTLGLDVTVNGDPLGNSHFFSGQFYAQMKTLQSEMKILQ